MTSDLSSDQVVLGPGIEVMVFLGFEVLVKPRERETRGRRIQTYHFLPLPQDLTRVQPTYLLAQTLAPRVNYYPQCYLPPLELTLGPSRNTNRLHPLFPSFLGMGWEGREGSSPSSVLIEAPPFNS